MKKIITILSLALCLALTNCNSSEKQVQDNIAMYSQTWDDVINNGNLDAINNENFDENITLVSSPENIVGIDAFKDYYSNFVTGFSDVEFTIVDIFGQGDKLVKHWHFKGTHSGEFFGMPASGKTVDVEGTTLVKMKDGKIAQEQDFMDNLVFMGQLGIDPFLNPNNLTTIQNLYASFGKGDMDAIKAAMDDQIVWNEAEGFPYADKNPYIGFDAIVEGVFSRLGSEWDNWHLTDMEFHEMTNGQILLTGRYSATYKKNGAPLDLEMAHLWTLKDGKIVSFQQFADTKGIHDVMNK